MSQNPVSLRPNAIEYDNFRTYLRDLYAHLKAERKSFSYRYFAKAAGFNSPNFLKLVIDGQRNLSQESIEKFIGALKVPKEEREHFRHLVGLNQAATSGEREHFTRLIFRSSAFQRAHSLSQAQYNYYSCWYMVPVRELVALPKFREDPKWVAQMMIPHITPEQALHALKELEQLGLLARDATGRLRQTDSMVTTPREVQSSLVRRYHREMMRMASESIERVASADRDISSVTISISHGNAQKIKEMIQRFREELMAVADEDKNPSQVYQINFQLFPFSHCAEQVAPQSAKEDADEQAA